MSTQIKYLAFKGIEKKERILFKSFLNLAKNELDFQVMILKEGRDHEPDFLIVDENYELEKDEGHLKGLPTILVGDDVDIEAQAQLFRPVKWNDFKKAVSQLDIPLAKEGSDTDRALPKDVEFAIMQGPADRSVGEESFLETTSEADIADYDFALESMSVDANSFTDSEYLHDVADDVGQYNQDDGEATIDEAVLLLDDDASVLVIETNKFDEWKFSESETNSVTEETEISEIIYGEFDQVTEEYDEETVVLEQKVGLQLKPNEEYWLIDNEIIVNHQTLFYIKPERSMIYSTKEPGLWPNLIRSGELSRLPLSKQWTPSSELKAFPMSCFYWVKTLVYDNYKLTTELDPEDSYILQSWPQFDLIEMDNALLKLCTMLFSGPKTIKSLISKSGYDRTVVVGLVNACHEMGLIKTVEEFKQTNIKAKAVNQSVMSKFIDVFR